MNEKIFFGLLLIMSLLSCEEEAALSDAYGNFEATVTTISAEATGKLLRLNVEEGDRIALGALVALVDTTGLHLQRAQLRAQINSFDRRLQSAAPDISVLEDQKRNLVRERDRTQRLVDAKAATTRQLDDFNGQIQVVERQIAAAKSRVSIANQNVLAGREPLVAQLDIYDDQIAKASVFNPVAGTVLTKLVEPGEIMTMGAPLYRIANLDTLVLRAYAGSVPLQRARVGKQVAVLIDAGAEQYEQLSGVISWIASEAEFTPKTIQTKEERVNLVYALKVRVPNPDGRLKLGMPAEVNFGVGAAGAMAKTEGQ